MNICFAHLLFQQDSFTITQKPNAGYVTVIKDYDDLLKVLARMLATQSVFINALSVYTISADDILF